MKATNGYCLDKKKEETKIRGTYEQTQNLEVPS